MSLTLRQQYEVLQAVRLLGAELHNTVTQLDYLKALRDTYGPDVVTLLDGVISPAEWQSTRDWVAARRDLLWGRVNAAMGAGLEEG